MGISSFSRFALALALTATVPGMSSAMAKLPEPGTVGFGDGYKVHGYVETDFQYNFNRPPVTSNVGPNTRPTLHRAYDREHYGFTLQQASVGISHAADSIGFDVRLGAGNQMDILNTADGVVDRTFAMIRRAAILVGGENMGLTLGRYDANFGLERVNAVDNWNYSRSFQFWPQPKVVNGAQIAFHLNPKWDLKLAAVNGFDRTAENNRGKGVLMNLNYASNSTAFGLNYAASAENPGGSVDWRQVANAYIKGKATSNLSLGGEFTFVTGTQEAVSTDVTIPRTGAKRYGVSALAMYEFDEKCGLAFRSEFFRDDHGAFTLLNKPSSQFAQTLTHHWNVSKNLRFWYEARWDGGNTSLYRGVTGDTEKSNQVTATVAATLAI